VSLPAKVALGLAVVVLVTAALLVATGAIGGDTGREAEAEEIVAELYSARELEDIRRHIVEESIRTGPETAEETREILETILAQPFDVEEVNTFTARGEELVEVRVGQVRWCVREDDRVLLGCRVALAEVESDIDTQDLTVLFAGVDVVADRLDAVVVVASETGEWIAIEGEPAIEVPDRLGRGELIDTALAGAGQQVSVPLDMLRAYPDAGALLAFEVRDVDLNELDDAHFTVSWEGVTVEVEVGRVLWLIG
jgi:hypothetical protein